MKKALHENRKKDAGSSSVADGMDAEAGLKRWYVIQAYSGYENHVAQTLQKRIQLENLQDKFGEIIVPTEEVLEIRGGKKRKVPRKFFPGYVLVQMEMSEATWCFVKKVPKILGFIGGTSDRPVPLTDEEADNILRRIQEGADKPRPKVLFEIGEIVRVVEGPFVDFNAVVEEVNYDKNRLRVSVLIFSRSTSVTLEFSQVKKI